MTNSDLTHSRTYTQDGNAPQGHGHPTDAHAVSWLNHIKGSLADVRSKLKGPLTAANRASLNEREARYSSYLNRAGWSA